MIISLTVKDSLLVNVCLVEAWRDTHLPAIIAVLLQWTVAVAGRKLLSGIRAHGVRTKLGRTGL